VVEQAKGILMKEHGLTEDDAYALIRKAAMNEGRKVRDVAQSVVTAAQLLRPRK
jgi:response regulator NasT